MRLLLASDGSPAARAALGVALGFPWPERTRVRGVVALGRTGLAMNAAKVRALHARAAELGGALRRRWKSAEVFELHDRPAEAILQEAARFGADAIVIGWRGHGVLARLVAGSVSRKVAEGARCAVLVVRAATPRARRFVVGFDGSANAGRATRFLARLEPPRGNRVALVNAPPSLASRLVKVQARQQIATRGLRARGWNAAAVVRPGEPVRELLHVARKTKAQVLVVGVPSRTGLERALAGSVASDLLDRSRLPVLIAR